MTDDLSGVALVTGSASGIGEGVARKLAAAGMTVVISSRSSVERGQQIADELGGSYMQADIGDEVQARELVARAVEGHGRLDLVVNNAGTTVEIPHDDLDSVTREVWQRILDVNLLGTWEVSRAAIPHLKQSPSGHIVNISSLGGSRPIGSSLPYAVSKAAVDHLTRVLANAMGPRVRVNAIAPGFIETPWTSKWDHLRERMAAEMPLRRTGLPEDIAEAVLGLHRSTFVTGQVLAVDGGRHLRY